MIFLDTSGVFALADRDDAMHDRALQMLHASQEADEEILTHSYILAESAALLQRRLGLKAAVAFLRDARQFHIVWVTSALHDEGVRYLQQHFRLKLSLVDAVSFVVARSEGINSYLGFDKHFDQAGMKRYPV